MGKSKKKSRKKASSMPNRGGNHHEPPDVHTSHSARSHTTAVPSLALTNSVLDVSSPARFELASLRHRRVQFVKCGNLERPEEHVPFKEDQPEYSGNFDSVLSHDSSFADPDSKRSASVNGSFTEVAQIGNPSEPASSTSSESEDVVLFRGKGNLTAASYRELKTEFVSENASCGGARCGESYLVDQDLRQRSHAKGKVAMIREPSQYRKTITENNAINSSIEELVRDSPLHEHTAAQSPLRTENSPYFDAGRTSGISEIILMKNKSGYDKTTTDDLGGFHHWEMNDSNIPTITNNNKPQDNSSHTSRLRDGVKCTDDDQNLVISPRNLERYSAEQAIESAKNADLKQLRKLELRRSEIEKVILGEGHEMSLYDPVAITKNSEINHNLEQDEIGIYSAMPYTPTDEPSDVTVGINTDRQSLFEFDRRLSLTSQMDDSLVDPPNEASSSDISEVDLYSGFDILDFDRSSLHGSKEWEPLQFSNIDEDLKAQLQGSWAADRRKKRLRKLERNKLRADGRLGNKNKSKADLSAKFKDGIPAQDLKEEIENFFCSSHQSLSLPPMAKGDRALIHKFASKLKLNSKSVGSGANRRPVLVKTRRTPSYNDQTLEHFERSFERLVLGGRSNKRPSPRDSGASYRNGEVVGASAPELGVENRGRAMLEKMGWSRGMTLGASDNNQALLVPIAHRVKTTRAGLG